MVLEPQYSAAAQSQVEVTTKKNVIMEQNYNQN